MTNEEEYQVLQELISWLEEVDGIEDMNSMEIIHEIGFRSRMIKTGNKNEGFYIEMLEEILEHENPK